MVLKYRWMQRKDLLKVSNKKDFNELLSKTKVIANVVELDDEILGWVVYRLCKDKLKIIRIAFKDDKTMEFIIENIRKTKNKQIQAAVSEYDLRLQVLLRKFGFKAIEVKKVNQIDFYIFVG